MNPSSHGLPQSSERSFVKARPVLGPSLSRFSTFHSESRVISAHYNQEIAMARCISSDSLFFKAFPLFSLPFPASLVGSRTFSLVFNASYSKHARLGPKWQ